METDNEKDSRPLSPILNKSLVYRRKSFTRRPSKTRINLSERFETPSETREVPEDSRSSCDFEFKVPVSPASKAKVVGFTTASGKSLHVSSELINGRYEMYKHILQADVSDESLVVFRKDFSFISSLKSHGPVTSNSAQSALDTQTAVTGEVVESCSDRELLDESVNEPPAKKFKANNDECGLLDDTLLNVFAKEDSSLLAENIARERLEFDSEAEVPENDSLPRREGGITKEVVYEGACVYKEGKDIDPHLPLMPGFTTAAGGTIEISEEALRRSENLLEDKFLMTPGDMERNIESSGASGFRTAAGGTIGISEEALKKSKKLFADDLHTKMETKQEEYCEDVLGFATAAGGIIPISEAALKRSEAILADHLWCSPEKKQLAGFATASGGVINISEEALKRSRELLGNDLPNEKLDRLCEGFTTAAGGMIKVSEEALKKSAKFLEQDLPPPEPTGFSTAAGEGIKISKEALKQSERLFGNEVYEVSIASKDPDFPTASGGDVSIPKDAWKQTGRIFSDELLALPSCENSPNISGITKSQSNSRWTNSFNNTPFTSPTCGTPTSTSGIRKRLGMSHCKQIAINNQSMAQAVTLFKDLDKPSSNIYSSTPLKDENQLQLAPKHSLLTELSITPVKHVSPTPLVETTSSTVLQEQTPGDTHLWMTSVRKQYRVLLEQLDILKKREVALEEQQKYLESQNNSRRRQTLGILSEKRASGKRLGLREAVADRKLGDRGASNSITFQHAALVHFTIKSNEIPPVVYTEDGAVLIPNLQNLIGLSEVEVAFKAMIGVDPKLIPTGWICNHYKLIVWKLAGYDRNLPGTFVECLTVENVVQQLKYRYDREIDKAERSALHRIVERDDVPQKRMVLCVSNIIKEGNALEIELTDGWYCIRTVIDELLKFQVKISKIVIGTKLIVQNAELLNCDGCHPLELPNHVRLRINYNCTRRATWYSKLGFQKDMKPFPVSLGGLHSDGGGVGCIRIHIFRVYPIRYLEKCEMGKSVWRNKKAEDRRMQEWENERLKMLESINRRVSDEFEKELKGAEAGCKVNYTKLSEVKSNEVLCQIACNDPEILKESLSSSQLEGVLQFQQEISNQRRQEISTRVSNAVNKLTLSKRQVSSVLKTQVVDRIKETARTFTLNIWNPTEEHLQLLKEGSGFFVYNVILKSNGDFGSTSKTYFTQDNSTFPKIKLYQRCFRSISSLHQSSSRPLINEYDTVGTIVQINKLPTNQEMWLTDGNANLLYMKIYHGADTCCLLDNVSRGRSVALLNLLYCERRLTVMHAIANQCSVVTSFPQQKFLQAQLDQHVEQLPKDLSQLLESCDKKIQNAGITLEKGMQSSISISQLSSLVETTGSYSEIDDSMEDNTLIPSRLTSTDVAMSLIDTDQYFESV
ncbi:hypothetical protein PPYR_09783 [Photinus pyralis]|uniref:BRCA2 OB1 domain-containing protein n=1 Tax=Photinus pyralis TaxID=7054 RepID=A0A5N4AEH3_PHOPY|nr:breast cancer type 2 susceptibility protein homolog isoform X2 [Photinus pyralis]KAB0795722.1 hypothetical protein PPYR_09783 [Photinus pyralis]